MAPAVAQFWNPFGSPQPQRRQQQQQFNPFGGWLGPTPQQAPEYRPRPKPAVTDSQAPPPSRRSPEAATAVTSPIVVLGDSMADWLGHGLEDAFSEKPEFGIVRKHRAGSGLVRYDPRRDVEWPQIAREIIAAERPKFIVMMVGFHDRQPIRERTASAKSAPSGAPSARPEPLEYDDPDSPESRARASAEQQNAEMQKAERDKAEREKTEKEKVELENEAQPAAPSDPSRTSTSGPMDFQSEAWQAAYVRRIDATMAALKSANVPVFWVGLPPQRNARQAADAAYLNELFRVRAERAGIIYVDIWDGFVDEAGRYVVQGPDFEGQIRRLRSGDGIYFTRAGARKLAHYVEREILRNIITRETPIALPAPEPAVQQPAKPGTTVRPLAGPVIPLTASFGGGKELLGGSAMAPAGVDALANRVLVNGEPITAPVGRADNFVWPRGSAAIIRESESEPAPTALVLPQEPAQAQQPADAAPAATAQPNRGAAQQPQTQQPPPAAKAAPPRARAQTNGEAKPPVIRRAPPQASNDGAPRPPLPILPLVPR